MVLQQTLSLILSQKDCRRCVRTISAKKNEPEWMLEYRLNA